MISLEFLFFALLFLSDYCVGDQVPSWQEADRRFREEVGNKLVLFSGPLMLLGMDKDQLEDWAEEARTRD
uniref:Uncharacterized protein n=1 Tax=Ditylenchus dipsaci TaxID=166011 RepID=A0A915ESJ5_9BILA